MPFYTKCAQNLHKMHNGFLRVTEDSKNPIYTKNKKTTLSGGLENNVDL